VSGKSVYWNKSTKQRWDVHASVRGPKICKTLESYVPAPTSAPTSQYGKITKGLCTEEITTYEECKAAGTDIVGLSFNRQYDYGFSYPRGCFVSGRSVYWNKSTKQRWDVHASVRSPKICKTQGSKSPTMSPTASPAVCDPKECNNWTCKDWCDCYTTHPEITKIFEGPNPSAAEEDIREMCPSDNDECDCDDYVRTTTN